MRSFLKDADSKQKEDAEVRELVAQIKEICFDVDDFIGTIIDGQTENRTTGFAESVTRFFGDLTTRYKNHKEIGRLTQKISDISIKRDDYGIRDINQGRQEASEAVVSYIVGKLGDLLIQEAQLLSGVREGVEWIKNELEWMQCFLKDADSKIKRDARVKKWVSDITDVSYEIEDVIETFIYSQRKRHGLVARVKGGISKPKTRHEVAKHIEQIKKTISGISQRRETSGVRDINEGRQEPSSSIRDLQLRRRFSALLDEPEVVGQQEEISSLKKQLINREQRRCVISLFGMGGSGKTSLARKVYHEVKNDFDCHAFICLSQQYEMKEVLIRLITSAMGKSRAEIENLTEAVLGMMLHEYLKEKRYLVVIDDIWSKEAWNMLGLVLPNGKDQSRVMLTTRIKDVALHADPLGHHHEMRLLNDDESWELFMKKIFPGKDPLTACPPELKEKGRKILAKCGGLPLVILVLGGLLSREEETLNAWSKVLRSVNRHLTESSCMEILALSYYDLPHYLKPCFLYFGLFPENYEISQGKLIRLWIAEGFIRQNGNNLMEDVVEDYLEQLVSRNMIQVARKRSNGSIHKCHIHDILRELSISKARENNFFTVHNDDDSRSSSTSVRRLAVYHNIDGDETKNHSIETLRSIFYFFNSKVDVLKLPNRSSKLLRVMNTAESEEYSNVSLPKEVGEFVHLRFLEFSRTYRFRSIPPSIGNLSSLQTLKVYEYSRGILPNTIWNLKELRHLHAHFHIKGDPHLSNLRNLQTLFLKAGSWIEEGLGRLTNLRKLGILEDVSSYHDTLPYCIEKLRNLRSLKLVESWGAIPPFMPFTHHLDLYKIYLAGSIRKLPELPPNLVELYLIGSELEQDAISTLEKLQHLKILKLDQRSYLGKQMICSPRGFPRLEFLELQSLPLEEWIVDEEAMISLKSVILFRMSKLKTVTVPKRVHALLKEGKLKSLKEEEK